MIRNDLLQEEDIYVGLIDYYDYVTFNLTNCRIDNLVLTKFIEEKSDESKDNKVYFQIYKDALNIYDTCCNSFADILTQNISEKNILTSGLSSNFGEDGTDYSILIYKKPGEINGPLYYELEGTPVEDELPAEPADNTNLSKSELISKIGRPPKALEEVSKKPVISSEIKENEAKIPKQADRK